MAELAPGTVAYLIRQNALNRRVQRQKNFNLSQTGMVVGRHAPSPDRRRRSLS